MVGENLDPEAQLDDGDDEAEILDEGEASSYQSDETGITEEDLAQLGAKADGPQTLKIVTINLRHDVDQWERRFPLIADEIARLKPDIIGLQEVEIFDHQATKLRDLIKARGGFNYRVYDHLKTGLALFSGEGIGILSRFPMEKTGHIDLGEGRLTVWARVRVATDLTVDFYNTHLHSQGGDEVRLPQAQKTTAWIAKQNAGHPIVLTGDMNAGETSATIKHFVTSGLVDSFKAVHGANTKTLGPTSPIKLAEGAIQAPKNRIDFVFAKGAGIMPTASEVRFKNADAKGFYPSDHLGVATTFVVP